MTTTDRTNLDKAADGAVATSFVARALYAGERIDLRGFAKTSRVIAQQPATVPLENGAVAMLFRFGAVVFIDGSDATRQQFLQKIATIVEDRYERPETEELHVSVRAEGREGVESGAVTLRDTSPERLQIVAAVLAKSVALAQYENDIAATFDRIEPFAAELEQGHHGGRIKWLLLQYIGQTLLDEHKMVARVEVSDRPELLWEHPELEQLYLRLEDEFEIEERAAILDRKLELIARTVQTILDLVQHDRSVRVEWYIVGLIVFEIFLSLYDLFTR